MSEIVLTGPRGDNPLGFLAALGACRVLDDAGLQPRLRWAADRRPVLVLAKPVKDEALVETVRGKLRRRCGAAADETATSRQKWESLKTRVKKKSEEIKKRRLPRGDRQEAVRCELEPLRAEASRASVDFRRRLRNSAPDSAVSLGLNLTAAPTEFSDFCRDAVVDAAPADRRWADLCASFGSDVIESDALTPDRRMDATPLALLNGQGHQNFLGTVQELMVMVEARHVQRALFGPWEACDDGLSLRLDVTDDRRYALMDRDPTASGNKPKTLWAANLLSFEALRFFPCAREVRGFATAGWRRMSAHEWRWPLWSAACSVPVVSSLLVHPDLWSEDAGARSRLRAMGCFTLLATRRISNGKFSNLSPPAPVW